MYYSRIFPDYAMSYILLNNRIPIPNLLRPEDLEETEEQNDQGPVTQQPTSNGDSTAIPMPEA